MYILSLDAGTTSARAIVFDESGAMRAVSQKEIPQHYPREGWVEHDAHDLWVLQRDTARQALVDANLKPSDLAGVGITNQRETTVVWERSTGKPIHRAIVWQDRRTADICSKLKAEGVEDLVSHKTGLVLDAYFSGPKIAWILDRVPGAREKAERGELAFGTVDTWLIWNLTAGRIHATDPTNASRTLLFNLHTGTWDDELLQLFRVPRSMLPEIQPTSGVIGEVNPGVLGPGSAPIAGVAGDQQAALFGQLCWKPGQAKTTYGTGCFMLLNTGNDIPVSKNRLLSTVGYQISGQTIYALEGSVFIGGAVVQWLRDGLKFASTSEEIARMALSVPDSGGVVLVPAFVGLGAPHWDASARGLLVGLTRGTTQAHIARAAIDAISFQVADLLDAMHADAGLALTEMRVDGGACQNDQLMQIQADLLGVPLLRPRVTETTALGAAYLAGLATGVWKNGDELASRHAVQRRFEPSPHAKDLQATRARWRRAVERAKAWADEESA